MKYNDMYYNFHVELVIKDKNGREVVKLVHNNDLEHSFEIHFTVPFSNEPEPADIEVEVFNLTATTRALFKKGYKATLSAGFDNGMGVIASGHIRKSVPGIADGVDRSTLIKIREGVDLSTNKKNFKKTFAKGTHGATIIKRAAAAAGISISVFNLTKNKEYKKGYTAEGKAYETITAIAEACKTDVYYRRGKLVIQDATRGHAEKFEVDSASGLLENPEYNDNDGEPDTWSVTLLLQPRISTGSIIKIHSETAKGSYRFKSGEHSYDGTDLLTTGEVVTAK